MPAAAQRTRIELASCSSSLQLVLRFACKQPLPANLICDPALLLLGCAADREGCAGGGAAA
jgi:hypothetical protein